MTPEFDLEVWDEILGGWMVADSNLDGDFATAIERVKQNAADEGRIPMWRVIKTEIVGKSNDQPIGG